MRYYFDKLLYDFDVMYGYCEDTLTPIEKETLHDKVVCPIPNSDYGRINIDHKVYTVKLGHCVID